MLHSTITCDGGQQLLFSYSDILRSVIYPELDVSVQRFAELFALILDTMTEEENEYLYSVNKRGRKRYLSLSIYGITLYMHYSRHETMKDTLSAIRISPDMRKVLFLHDDVPSEATMSKRTYGLMEHVDQRRMAVSMCEGRIILNASIDSSICQAREKAVNGRREAKKEEKKKGKKGRPKKGSEEEEAIRERQEAEARACGERRKANLELSPEVLLSSLDLEMRCSWTAKVNSLGKRQWFRGYKIHILADDNGMIASYLITGASVHDSKVAIYLMKCFPSFCYALMDKGYVSNEIEDFCSDAGHMAIIDRRSNQKEQLSPRVAEIYRKRTTVERSNSSFKECFLPPRLRFRARRFRFAIATAALMHNAKTQIAIDMRKKAAV